MGLFMMACNSEDEMPQDAAEQTPVELEDVQDDLLQSEMEESDIHHEVPLEPEDPELPEPDTVVDPERQDEPAQQQSMQDQNSQPDRARPVVTIPPEVITPEYKPLLNERNELVVSGRTVDELIELIGEPPHLLRQGHRGSGWHKEVWILPIYQEDSTGLYIYIRNGNVEDWRLDTFVGLGNHPQLLEWFK